jgi:hypothetical protein
MHERGVAMNYRSLFQSAVFILLGLALLSALSIAVQWWIPRLAFAICVGGVCLIAEVIAVVKIAQLLWKWSGWLATGMFRLGAGTVGSTPAQTEKRGEV